MHPFTIILKAALLTADPAPLRIKLDPGSRTTGLAVVNDATGAVVWAAELQHRGSAIKRALAARRWVRRNRRARHCRHRPPRYRNRQRPAGWLPPSLQSRVANMRTWVQRLCHLAPIRAISLELVRFDTQKMQDAEIRGVAYQQGELAGYEVREYLLQKWDRRCAYCGTTDGALEVEHILPRSRGGSDRVSNLTLACHACNERKGTRTAAEFGYPQIQRQAQVPLHDAAAVNSTRPALYRHLQATGLPVEVGSGGRTQYNRRQRRLPKRHWLDAACVGASTPPRLHVADVQPLGITACGWGNRQMCGTNRYGFPIRHRTRRKVHAGFQTGDLVRAVIPQGKYPGVHVGRVAVRAQGTFCIRDTRSARRIYVHPRHCRRLQRADGYSYAILRAAAVPADGDTLQPFLS
jgi:5-methylcytosine-specific restriction endonuclease McrA